LWIRAAGEHSSAFSVYLGMEQPAVEGIVKLAPGVGVAGDPESLREAQQRWSVDRPLSPIAEKARRLAESYDSWFLVVKPFAVMVEGTVPLPQHVQALTEAIEEVSGGVRFGAVTEVYVEAVFRNPEDASAVARLARWLPGLVQLKGAYLGPFVEAMENFTVHASGQRAFLSVRIPEDKLRELAEKGKGRVIDR
jgi:hypothetical protein